MNKNFYRRHLPHVHPPCGTLFITFRLANSLPLTTVDQLRVEHRQNLHECIPNSDNSGNKDIVNHHLLYFLKFDQILDNSSHGMHWLQRPEIAQQVYDAIQYHNNSSYQLDCCTIMPNHVYMLIEYDTIATQKSIPEVLQSIKKYSARRSNKILNRVGRSFWQSESYDHVIRNEREFENTLKYIIYNPVKTKLCEEWTDWKWTYVKDENRTMFT